MKKLYVLISILLCIFLTACGNDKSIGIIGGADGPTSIIVEEKGEIRIHVSVKANAFRAVRQSF